MALETPGKLTEFFLLLCGNLVTDTMSTHTLSYTVV